MRFGATAILETQVLDGENYRDNTPPLRGNWASAARSEETQLALKSLIATAEASIRETRALIAELGKILATSQLSAGEPSDRTPSGG